MDVPHGVDPVVGPGIAVRHDNAHRAVGPVARGVLVDPHRVIPVVERFHPVVVELEVPCLAFRGHGINDQGLIFADFPVAVIIGYGRVAVRGQGRFGIKEWKFVGVLPESFGPVREQGRRAQHGLRPWSGIGRHLQG